MRDEDTKIDSSPIQTKKQLFLTSLNEVLSQKKMVT